MKLNMVAGFQMGSEARRVVTFPCNDPKDCNLNCPTCPPCKCVNHLCDCPLATKLTLEAMIGQQGN